MAKQSFQTNIQRINGRGNLCLSTFIRFLQKLFFKLPALSSLFFLHFLEKYFDANKFISNTFSMHPMRLSTRVAFILFMAFLKSDFVIIQPKIGKSKFVYWLLLIQLTIATHNHSTVHINY